MTPPPIQLANGRVLQLTQQECEELALIKAALDHLFPGWVTIHANELRSLWKGPMAKSEAKAESKAAQAALFPEPKQYR